MNISIPQGCINSMLAPYETFPSETQKWATSYLQKIVRFRTLLFLFDMTSLTP
jgi:hypothetical protein